MLFINLSNSINTAGNSQDGAWEFPTQTAGFQRMPTKIHRFSIAIAIFKRDNGVDILEIMWNLIASYAVL